MYNYALAYHFGYMGREKTFEKAKDMYQQMMSLVLKSDTKATDYEDSLMLNLNLRISHIFILR